MSFDVPVKEKRSAYDDKSQRTTRKQRVNVAGKINYSKYVSGRWKGPLQEQNGFG